MVVVRNVASVAKRMDDGTVKWRFERQASLILMREGPHSSSASGQN